MWLATGGLELGAVSVMLYGFREREVLMDMFESITGLRMNHAYIRIGGVIMDIHEEGTRQDPRFPRRHALAHRRVRDAALDDNPIWIERNRGVGVLSADDALALGVTGPMLRSAGVAGGPAQGHAVQRLRDLRLRRAGADEADAYARYAIRLDEMRESMRIVEQCMERLEEPGPVMIEDPKVALARASSRWAPTASATTRRTCATSWRNRWRR